MSVETYNPNEVAKVKHLIALAESIAEQFGGGTGETATVDTRQTPTLSVSGVPSLATIRGTDTPQGVGITYNGDGVTYMKRKSGCAYVYFMANTQNTAFFMGKPSGTQAASVTAGTFIVGAYGTDNFKPIEIEVTFE